MGERQDARRWLGAPQQRATREARCHPVLLPRVASTELLLKSALLKRGFTDAELRGRQFGHSLNALLTALQAKGVTVTSDTVGLVTGLHTQHSTHALRYTAFVDDGTPTYMPPPQLVLDMLTELLMLPAISTQGV